MDELNQARQLIQECMDTQNPYLDLGNCGITDLHNLPELFDCTHLETLILSNEWYDTEVRKVVQSKNEGPRNKIDHLSKNIQKLNNLSTLKIGGGGYMSLFADRWSTEDIHFLEKLTSLQILYLSDNKISDYTFLKKLPQLHSLFLNDNKISDISFLEKLPQLRTLFLSDNNISDISFLEKLINLQRLYLCDNKISNYSFIGKLINLKRLDLSFNYIPDISFLKELTQLQHLYLSDNKISDISFLKKLTQLQSLFLRSNQISDISFFEKLTNLQQLFLGSNQISDCTSLEKLTNLQSLDLAFNQISDISFLEKLTSLQYLDLRNNKISDIPLSTFQLEMEIDMDEYGTGGLCLYNNPIQSPPLDIVKQGRQSVLDWFGAAKQKLNEIKVILIGGPKAGKTSLLKRLKYDAFREDEVQTDGVNIEDIVFGECDTFREQTKLHELTGHFWDFGGQEIMNATHQFFLTKRSVYVLVLDARKDAGNAAQIRQWLRRVTATGGNSPVIVVANQVDINQGFGFENEYELRKEFPQITDFIKLSCKTRENIEALKTKLEAVIPTAELFDTSIDEKWITIKDILEKETKKDDYLNEKRFLEICKKNGLDEKRKQKNAINFLHDLGLVLHFDDINLTEYYVLNPYWITYGVYQILTSASAGRNKGEVSMDETELGFIVNEEKDKKGAYRTEQYKKKTYSTNERRFLVDILHYFELCFFIDNNTKFIIPDLLDTKEPVEITEPIRTSGDTIKFVYEYGYLPKPVMPNIMVKTHQKIITKWRTGFILENNGCTALITNYENRISIVVCGDYKRRREFMAVNRFIIDTINQQLSNKPTAHIPLPGTDEYVAYEELLEREKDGEKFYTVYKPVKKKFEIAVLLEGVPSQEEVRNAEHSRILKEIQKDVKTLKEDHKEQRDDHKQLKEDHREIIKTLQSHYDYLVALPLPGNKRIKKEIQEALQEINTQQTQEITSELMQWIANAFDLFSEDMDEKLEEIYTDLKKSDDWQAKLKLAVPFINLLGITIEAEFDVKSKAQKLYDRYKFKIFKLMGLV